MENQVSLMLLQALSTSPCLKPKADAPNQLRPFLYNAVDRPIGGFLLPHKYTSVLHSPNININSSVESMRPGPPRPHRPRRPAVAMYGQEKEHQVRYFQSRQNEIQNFFNF